MTFDQMIPSRFLKKEDFNKPGLLTIKEFKLENVAREDEAPDNKWVLYFNEVEQGMVLNTTNIQLLKVVTGINDPDQARGKQIVVYVDPTVGFGGKITGGLRIRAPRSASSEPEV